MKKHTREAFPQIPYFQEHDRDGCEQECATISGVYGVCLVAMIYGLRPIYFKNNWPGVSPEDHLSIDTIKKLKPFDLSSNPVVEQLFSQMDIIQKRWGKVDGYLNYQGVLNNAFKIRGTDIFLDMVDDPGHVHFLLEHITDTMIKLIQMVQKKQRESGFNANSFGTSNCVVNMISADSYAEFILPYDIKLSKSFERFGIHSCNWSIDRYINEFNKIQKLGYIDLGFASDLRKVKAGFPNAVRHVFYNQTFLVRKTEEEIRRDIVKIYEELGPCELTVSDIEADMPDEKIIRFAEMTRQVTMD